MYTGVAALVRLHDLTFGFDGEGHRFLENEEETEIDRCKAEIDPSVLAKYEQLKRRYGATAIVEVNGNICMGCRMALPSIKMNRLKSGVAFCESCGRMLFHPELAYRFQY